MKKINERLVVGLCVGSFVLVLLSESLGLLVVRRPYAGGGWQWNNEDAHRAAEVLRWLGAMLLATGLIERVVYALSKFRAS